MKTASWVILALVGGLTMLGSMASCYVAYRGPGDEQIGPTTLSQLGGGLPEVATAVRARRATAAAYAAGFAALFLAITIAPYRRGDSWAWWALLAGTLAMAVVSLLRVPLLGTRAGAGTALITLVVVALGLALGAGRLRSGPAGG
jgi:peptidoglycan/LPS O-acetylase OafA/YrhL